LKLKIVFGVCATAALWAQGPASPVGAYEGPSILSRGIIEPGRRGSEGLSFRMFAQVNGVFDNGLLPISVDPGGQLYSDGLWGMEARVGAYGYHTWRRSSLGLDYNGNFRHYTQKTYYDGSDHFLTLDYKIRLSKRVTLDFYPTAGTYARSFGYFGLYTTVLGADITSPLPVADIFDNRTYFAQANASLVFQKSARLSFSVGGDGFTVRRQSQALIDNNGYDAKGDVAYRLNRSQTVSASYGFTHYGYSGVYGSTDIHMLSVSHSLSIGRNTEFLVSGGAVRVELTGLQRVIVDPAIAALVGQYSTIAAFHRVIYIPSVNLTLTRRYRTSTFGASARQGVSPGNGLYLTSRQQTAGVFYGYTGIRRWNFAGGFNYLRMQNFGFALGGYGTYTAGAGVVYRLNNFLHLNTRVDARHADLTITGFRRSAVRVTAGITIAPGELPVSLW